MNKKILIIFTLLINLTNNVQAEEKPQLLELNRNISVLESKKLNLDEQIKLATFYKRTAQDTKAINLCKNILIQNPNNTYIFNLLGDLYKRNYQYDLAKKYYQQISLKSPEYNSSLISLMIIATSLSDNLFANEILDKSDKNNIVLYKTILGIYNYSSLKLNPKEARINFEEVLSKDPNQKEALYYLALIDLDDNKRLEAKNLLNHAIKQDFYFSSLHSSLGYIEFLDKNLDKSFDELKTALMVNIMDSRSLISLGNGMTKTNYEILEKDNPNLKANDEFFNTGRQAIKLVNKGQNKQAKDLINQLKIKYPNNIHSYIQAGSLDITIGDYQDAIKMYQQALKINSDYGVANNGLSIVIYNLIRNQQKEIKLLDLDVNDYSKI
ncbi:MAG: hypothetical protein H7263_02915, partial [Candidatus Sericytochromatia bacterium]|nr:hypothetical protein [Candidatus Sericytochromatia bacterium]